MLNQTLLNEKSKPTLILTGKAFKTTLINTYEIYMTNKINPEFKSRTPTSPIIVLECYGEYFIIDGNHRFAEQSLKNKKIRSKIINEDNINKIPDINIYSITILHDLNYDITQWRKEIIAQHLKETEGVMSPGKILIEPKE